MSHEMIAKFQGCLAGVQIGDALGRKSEGLTKEEIIAAMKGKPITGFDALTIPKFHSIQNLPDGMWTDDWQMTRALARSLIRCHGYNQVDCAIEFLREMEKTQAGWGGSVKKSMLEIKEYFDSRGEKGRHPVVPAQKIERYGTGNGVAMRVMPIALWSAVSNFNKDKIVSIDHELILQNGFITHGDPAASLVSSALGYIAALALYNAVDEKNEMLDKIIEYAKVIEIIYPAFMNKMVECYPPLHWDDQKPSDIFLKIKKDHLLDNPDKLLSEIGSTSYSLESVPFAIATFLRHPKDFRTGVLEAINAGGDTDTTASIVGALIGVHLGVEAIPEEWLNFRPEYNESIEIGEKLYHAAKHQR